MRSGEEGPDPLNFTLSSAVLSVELTSSNGSSLLVRDLATPLVITIQVANDPADSTARAVANCSYFSASCPRVTVSLITRQDIKDTVRSTK